MNYSIVCYVCGHCRLHVLNGTKNHLTSLPLLNNNADLNNVRELYLSQNELGNNVLEIVAGYSRLQILHLAYNELTELYDRHVPLPNNLQISSLECFILLTLMVWTCFPL